MLKNFYNEDYYCFWTIQQAPSRLSLRDQSPARPQSGPWWKRVDWKAW